MNAVERIVQRFGGTRAMARALGVNASNVDRWRHLGRIPAKRQPLILELGQALDPPLQPADFFDRALPQFSATRQGIW